VRIITSYFGSLNPYCRRAKWIDRKVLPQNLRNQKNSPNGDGTDAIDQPGLKEMTIKAIDVLQQRQKSKNTGWFMMSVWLYFIFFSVWLMLYLHRSEAASIDKVIL
jgi:hypothetical protein